MTEAELLGCSGGTEILVMLGDGCTDFGVGNDCNCQHVQSMQSEPPQLTKCSSLTLGVFSVVGFGVEARTPVAGL